LTKTVEILMKTHKNISCVYRIGDAILIFSDVDNQVGSTNPKKLQKSGGKFKFKIKYPRPDSSEQAKKSTLNYNKSVW